MDFDNILLRQAEALLTAGFCGLWLRPKQKRPYANKWASLPVPDWPEMRNQHRAGANLGIRLGRFSETPCGFAHVIDMDVRVDSDVGEAYEALHRLFPEVDFDGLPSVQSGSGGLSRHFYIFTDQPFRSKVLAHSVDKFVDDEGKAHFNWEIELFGTGKQVAAPPSIHPSGGQYRWITPIDFDLLDLGAYPVVPSSSLSDSLVADRKAEATFADDDDALLALVNVDRPLGLTEEEAAELLDVLPTSEWLDVRDKWLQLGMACHHEFEGSDVGFDLWCTVSAKSDKFDPDDQLRVWKSFGSHGGDSFTFASIKLEVARLGKSLQLAINAIESARHYSEALEAAAKFDLKPSEVSQVVSKLIPKAKGSDLLVSDKDIRKDFDAARKDAKAAKASEALSLEAWLASETVNTFYSEGDHLLYINGNPWVYDKGLWQLVDKTKISKHVFMLSDRVLSRSKTLPNGLVEFAAESGRLDRLDNLCSSVARVVAMRQEASSFENPLGLTTLPNESVINARNCELVFLDGAVHELAHDPLNYRTSQVAAEYDPDATSPKWDAMLERIFRDNPDTDEIIRHLYEVLGYLVQSDRSMASWILFYGSGSNGKSAVASIIQGLLGDGACASISIPTLSRDNHALSSLVGKAVVLDDDFEKKAVLPDGWIKKLSEGKILTANPKFAAPFEFVSTAVPMILSNHWPRTSDLSFGLARRAQVFHFNSTIEPHEVDHKLPADIIESELSGVLNHLIKGWLRLRNRGRWLVPDSVAHAKGEWLRKRNALAEFISDHLEVTDNPKDVVKGSEIWDLFTVWCPENNTRNSWGRNTFYSEIEDWPGVGTRTSGGGVVAFYNVRLKGAAALVAGDHMAKGNSTSVFEDLTLDDLI